MSLVNNPIRCICMRTKMHITVEILSYRLMRDLMSALFRRLKSFLMRGCRKVLRCLGPLLLSSIYRSLKRLNESTEWVPSYENRRWASLANSLATSMPLKPKWPSIQCSVTLILLAKGWKYVQLVLGSLIKQERTLETAWSSGRLTKKFNFIRFSRVTLVQLQIAGSSAWKTMDHLTSAIVLFYFLTHLCTVGSRWCDLLLKLTSLGFLGIKV